MGTEDKYVKKMEYNPLIQLIYALTNLAVE